MTEQMTIITKIIPSLLGDRRTLESVVGLDRLIVEANKTAIIYAGDTLMLYVAENFTYIDYKRKSEETASEVIEKTGFLSRILRPECTGNVLITKVYERIEDKAEKKYSK